MAFVGVELGLRLLLGMKERMSGRTKGEDQLGMFIYTRELG